jgi:hypothetical protein
MRTTDDETITAEWLAAGHRPDDPALWRRLCEWMEQKGRSGVRQFYQDDIPTEVRPLVLDSAAVRLVRRQLSEQCLMPIWYKSGRGWLLKRDWRTRLDLMTENNPERIRSFMRATLTQWLAENVQLDPYGEDGEELPEEEQTRYVCQMCDATGDTRDLEHAPSCGIHQLAERLDIVLAETPGGREEP